MQVPFSPPDMSEAEVEQVIQALRSGWITTGPMTRQFEEELAAVCGTKRVKCLASATAAMELCLRLLGVGPDDEVITCAYTYTASASVAVHVGARPVLVDCLPGSPYIDPEKVAEAITEKTKAIIPVDFGGIPADYRGIFAAIESKHKLFRPEGGLQQALGRVAVVGDCAHSFGAEYDGKNVAQAPDFACFSFHAVKNLTTAEGGAVALHDIGEIPADELYWQLSLLSLHGQNKDALDKSKAGSWEYDILVPGYKCNMTDIMAAIGRAQLNRYPALLERRRQMVARYNRQIEGTRVHPIPHTGACYSGSHHLYVVAVDGLEEGSRNAVIAALGERGVSVNVHYKPLPLMTAYRNLGWRVDDFPNAFGYYKKEITLPLHTLLSDEQIDYTAQSLREILGEARC